MASIALSANAFRFVSFRELLEAETGITTNEPDQVALQQAIERAVHSLVLEGAQLGYWRFDDPDAAAALLGSYQQANVNTPAPASAPQESALQSVVEASPS